MILRFMDELGIERAMVVGHDTGGGSRCRGPLRGARRPQSTSYQGRETPFARLRPRGQQGRIPRQGPGDSVCGRQGARGGASGHSARGPDVRCPGYQGVGRGRGKVTAARGYSRNRRLIQAIGTRPEGPQRAPLLALIVGASVDRPLGDLSRDRLATALTSWRRPPPMIRKKCQHPTLSTRILPRGW